jgi:hydroxymethylpyrimidine/phosphomethylpyrimidine kinase
VNGLPPIVLTIAGFDPSGGAGISADLKTFAAHNCYGVAAITSLTAQNTQGVVRKSPVDPAMLKESLDLLFADGRISAIKIGMLGDRANAEIIAKILEAHPETPVVLDPVLRSATGFELLSKVGLDVLQARLLKRATVVTPNLSEAAALTGLKVENIEEMKTAAQKLLEMGAKAAVITGGHLEKAVDVFFDGSNIETFSADKIKPDNTHGAGCTFSSAVAANLALGRQLRDSIMLAKAYVTEAIRKAYPVGPGRIPLNHFHRMQQAPRPADFTEAVPEPVH